MYYFLFFIFIVFTCLSQKKYNKILYFALFFCFWFTSGWRYETGTDYFTYDEIYNLTHNISNIDKYNELGLNTIEPGYLLLNSIFKSVGLNINIMFFFISFITSLLLFYSYEKYLPKYMFFCLLSYFAFIYFQLDMSGVRQAIALNIFLFSLQYIYSKKIYIYFLCILIASMFHLSVLVAIPLYFILNRKFSSFSMSFLVLLSLVIILFKIRLIPIIITMLTPFFSSNLLFKLLTYSAETIEPWPFNIKVFMYITLFFILLKNRNKLKTFPYFNIILNLLFLFVLFRNILWESIEIDMRLGFYFSIGLTMGLPLLLELYKIKLNKIIILTFIVFINFYQCYDYFFFIKTFTPYQNYIVHKALGLKSNGQIRYDEFKLDNEK